MVEKAIQNVEQPLEVEGVGEEIQLPQPENLTKGIEIVQDEDGGVTLDYDPNQKQSEG